MTADAQALQVALVMSAAICQRFDVMHQSGLGESSLTLTPFTKWTATDVAVSYLPPILIVSLVMFVATSKVLVVLLHHLPVVFAVTAFVVGQLWATAVSARSLGFHGHGIPLAYRAYRMDDIFTGQSVCPGNLCLTCPAAVQRPALCQKLRPSGSVYGSIHATTAKQALIGGINNGISIMLCRNISQFRSYNSHVAFLPPAHFGKCKYINPTICNANISGTPYLNFKCSVL